MLPIWGSVGMHPNLHLTKDEDFLKWNWEDSRWNEVIHFAFRIFNFFQSTKKLAFNYFSVCKVQRFHIILPEFFSTSRTFPISNLQILVNTFFAKQVIAPGEYYAFEPISTNKTSQHAQCHIQHIFIFSTEGTAGCGRWCFIHHQFPFRFNSVNKIKFHYPKQNGHLPQFSFFEQFFFTLL